MRLHSEKDRRVQRTKQAIQDSMLTLLEEEPINRISVSRLCQLAGINRSTFYTYFADPEDLLIHIEEELVREIQDRMGSFSGESYLSQLVLSLSYTMNQHQRLCAILFSRHCDTAFLDRMILLIQERVLEEWGGQHGLSPVQKEMLYTFVARGCVGVVEHWAASGFMQPPEEVATLLERFSCSVTRMLESAAPASN